MKFNSFLFSVACAGVLLNTSCNPTMQENQLKYTHTSLVDNDAFQAFKILGAKIPYEEQYAGYAADHASTAATKELAGKVQSVFSNLLPQLDSLAVKYQVNFPTYGALEFEATEEAHVEADSAATEGHHAHASFTDDHYTHHVQHEVAVIKDQLERLSRNTNKEIRDIAAAKLVDIQEIYVAAGGSEHAHAHH